MFNWLKNSLKMAKKTAKKRLKKKGGGGTFFYRPKSKISFPYKFPFLLRHPLTKKPGINFSLF
jgi:hypothetical protein